jgi:DNA-binding transcriptional MerR regulator
MSDHNPTFDITQDGEFLSRLVVGIGEVADITGVPQRQIRYWQDKGIIQAVTSGDSSTRRYDYLNIKKILLVKQLLDEGYTLDAATAKVAKYTEMVQTALAKLKERKR